MARMHQYSFGKGSKSVFAAIYASATRNAQGMGQFMRNDIYFNQLQRGEAILSTDDQADVYLHSFGKMHKAKLVEAFDAMPALKNLQSSDNIQVLDYGCGQGLASVVFLDYIQQSGVVPYIDKVTLIEPSQLCLKRAESNVNKALHAGGQCADVLQLIKHWKLLKVLKLKAVKI